VTCVPALVWTWSYVHNRCIQQSCISILTPATSARWLVCRQQRCQIEHRQYPHPGVSLIVRIVQHHRGWQPLSHADTNACSPAYIIPGHSRAHTLCQNSLCPLSHSRDSNKDATLSHAIRRLQSHAPSWRTRTVARVRLNVPTPSPAACSTRPRDSTAAPLQLLASRLLSCCNRAPPKPPAAPEGVPSQYLEAAAADCRDGSVATSNDFKSGITEDASSSTHCCSFGWALSQVGRCGLCQRLAVDFLPCSLCYPARSCVAAALCSVALEPDA
jgi:hypothetical protein